MTCHAMPCHAACPRASDEPLGEGGGISFTSCTSSFDGLSACGANDTIFVDNDVGRKVRRGLEFYGKRMMHL